MGRITDTGPLGVHEETMSKLMDYATSEAAFGGNENGEIKLSNVATAIAFVFGNRLQEMTQHPFDLELSHTIHRLIHRGENNAGELHDPSIHGHPSSDGSRAAGLSVAEVKKQLNELFRLGQTKVEERRVLSREDKFHVAAYFIHRYLDIHPYGDGNGRVARLLTSLLLMRLGAVSKPLRFDKPSESRQRYIGGLHQSPVTGPESKDKLEMLVKLTMEAAEVPEVDGCFPLGA